VRSADALRIQVNGESHEVADEVSLQDLVNSLDLAPKRLAIELNQNVVRRGDWPAMILKEDDRVEIVHFVGGGLEDERETSLAGYLMSLQPAQPNLRTAKE